MKLYEALAQTLHARINCEHAACPRGTWAETHAARLTALCREHLPSGSGFDNGSVMSDKSNPNRLIFATAFHHMDESGFYSGWTHHNVIVTPDLALRFNVRVTGRDRNSIKDFIADAFAFAMNIDVEGY